MSECQAEISSYLKQVEGETFKSLERIGLALRKSGMRFDKKVRAKFLKCVDERLEDTFNEIDKDFVMKDQSSYSSDDSMDEVKRRCCSKNRNLARNKSKRNKEVKRLQKSKKSIKKKDEQKRSKYYPHKSRRRHRSSTDQSSECEYTQVALVSSSSFSPKKTKKRSDPPPDPALVQLTKLDLATGLEQKVQPHNLTYRCFYCSMKKEDSQYDGIEDVFVHWFVQHRFTPEMQSFQFCAVENVACYFCDMIDSYQLVLEHQKSYHPNESIVIVAEVDRKKCALCPYSGNALIGHFEIEHELLLQLNDFNPLGLDDDTLNGLLCMNAQKRYCELCFKFFDSEEDAAKHRLVKHPDVDIEGDFEIDGEVKHLICFCKTKISQSEYYSHIQGHFCSFECSMCDQFKATNLIDLVEHDKNIHKTSTLKFRCMELSDQLMKYYFATKIVFSNGLVLIMHNVLNTKFDISNRFKKVVEEVLGTKVKEPEVNIEQKSIRDESLNRSRSTDSQDNRRDDPKKEWHYQNQFSRDLTIEGIPLIEGEKLQTIFLNICYKIGVKISRDDITFIRRMLNHPNKIIHVRLDKQSIKSRILEKKFMKDLKSGDFIDLPWNIDSTQVYINRYVTKYFGKLCKIAKDAVKKKQLHSYNMDFDGVYVKRKENAKGIHIISEYELFKYIDYKKSRKY